MSDIVEALAEVVGGGAVSVGEAIHDDYTHDEALTAIPQRPLAVVRSASTAEVARVVRHQARLDQHRSREGSGEEHETGQKPRGEHVPGEGMAAQVLQRQCPGRDSNPHVLADSGF